MNTAIDLSCKLKGRVYVPKMEQALAFFAFLEKRN